MGSSQQPLVIKDWQNGIAESPHLGHGLLRNADVESFPGALKVSKKPQTYFHTITTRTFTADAGTDECTASDTLMSSNFSGAAVYFTTTNTLPAGLSINTVYYLIWVSNTVFKVATSYKNSVGSTAGTAIDITGAGTGVHTIHQIAIGTVNWILEDPNTTYIWMLDSNGRTWFVPSGTRAYLLHNSAIESVASTLTAASGNGLAIFRNSDASKTYLFTFRNALIDVIEITGNTAIEALSWSNAWQSMNTGSGTNNSHHAITAQDNMIYFCDARYVGSIREIPGQAFDPASGATFTYSNSSLDLPQGEIAQCLEEQGTNLLTGGNSYNKIYPWDRISDSYNLPITVPEYGVKRMKNVGGVVYVLAGTWGWIYTTQGIYAKPFRKIPSYVVNNASAVQSTVVTWGGIGATNSAILIGLAGLTSGSSGMYFLYPDGRLIHENTPSSGSANVVGLLAKDNFYIMGYAGGADNFSLLTLYDNYNTVHHSPLYAVGNKTQKASYSELEVQVAKPATTGHFRIKYRTDESSAFANFPGETVTATADSTTTSWSFDAGLTDLENLQTQIEMDGDFEMIQVILRP